MVCHKMGIYALVAYKLRYYTVQFKNTKPEEEKYTRYPRNIKSKHCGTKTPVLPVFLLHPFSPKLPFISCNLHFGFMSYFPLHFGLLHLYLKSVSNTSNIY